MTAKRDKLRCGNCGSDVLRAYHVADEARSARARSIRRPSLLRRLRSAASLLQCLGCDDVTILEPQASLVERPAPGNAGGLCGGWRA